MPGLIAVAVLLGLAIFTLTYARLGALRGPTFTVYLPVNEARNVITGTDVWLAGRRVGAVRTITFRSADVDPRERILMELTILRRYHDLIRRDSEADIRSGGTLLGAPVINISVGSISAENVTDGDTLRRAAQRELADAATELAALGPELREIMQNLVRLRETAAGLDERVAELNEDRQSVMRLLTRGPLADRPEPRAGTLQALVNDDEIGPRISRIRAGMDGVVAALDSPTGTVGRLQREQALGASLDSIAAELAEVSRLLEGGYGTAGRLMHDRALVEGVEALRLEIRLLQEDARRWPERYLRF